MNQNLFNKILMVILAIETVFVSGVVGYKLGIEKEMETEPPIYHITIQVDPSMIEYEEESDPEPEEQAFAQAEAVYTEPEPEPELVVEPSYTETEVEYLAKTIWGEARGTSKTQQSAVAWCVLNRVESDLNYIPNDIVSVITQESQFTGYKSSNPVTEEHYTLAKDVLDRWDLEKAGVTDVGRTLPKDYLWFAANSKGTGNVFRNEWRSGTRWDWSLESPYE